MRFLTAFMAFLIVATVGFAMPESSHAQDEQTRFVLKLDDKLISSFKKFGSLKSDIPKNFQNKINFIELQHSSSKDKEAIISSAMTDVSDDIVKIELDDSIISKVMEQPVRIEVGGKSFSEILLNYKGTMTKAVADPMMAKAAKPGMAMAEMFFIKMSNGEKMAGAIEGFDKFQMETAFGEISIPSTMIAGVRFHTDGEDSAVVILSNGDSITGIPTIDSVSVATDWGTADVEPRFIDSMTTAQNSNFVQNNTTFGSRWQLNSTNTTVPNNGSRQPFRNPLPGAGR